VQQGNINQNQINALDNLLNAVDMEADFSPQNHGNNGAQDNDSQSSITQPPEGVNSVNNPVAFILDQEVNQLQIIPVIDHPPQDAPGPVIVHGNEQGMNFDNFM
jgi:hypothetical protein